MGGGAKPTVAIVILAAGRSSRMGSSGATSSSRNSTACVHRWVLLFSPRLLEYFNRRKRQAMRKWNLGETYIKIKGEWMYRYRAIDSSGDTVEFYFSRNRDLQAAKRFLRKALTRHSRLERIYH